jgi:hypothetical protein
MAVPALAAIFSSEFFSDPASEGWTLLRQHTSVVPVALGWIPMITQQ